MGQHRHSLGFVGNLHINSHHDLRPLHPHHHQAAMGEHRSRNGSAAAVEYQQQLQKHGHGHEHEPQHEAGEGAEVEEEEEEHHDYLVEDEDEEEEPHADSEHLADTHPEYGFSHEGAFDNSKQHPDEPEYIDIWVSLKHTPHFSTRTYTTQRTT